MSKPTMQDVREFIRHAGVQEIRMVYDICASRMKHIQAELAQQFTHGEWVTWVSGKRRPTRWHGKVVGMDGKWLYLQTTQYVPSPLRTKNYDYKIAPSFATKCPPPPGR